MSVEDRREKGRRLCRRLAEDVAAIAPPGLGLWPQAWETVQRPSTELLDVLLEWQRTGDATLVARIRELYDATVESWREAARRFEHEAGRPRPRETAR